MNRIASTRLKAVWNEIEFSEDLTNPLVSPDHIDQLIGKIFCPGPFYWYIFNFTKLEFDYISPSVEQITGIPQTEANFNTLARYLHPEDLPHMEKCEKLAAYFLYQFIPSEKIKNYKVSYFIRLQNEQNRVSYILHQSIAILTDQSQNIHKVLGIHTDVSHLLNTPIKTISFLSIDGKDQSYLGIHPDYPEGLERKSWNDLLSSREKEILGLLSEGLTDNQIAENLSLSNHTVRTHRNNIRKKLDCSNTTQMVAKAIRLGII